MSELLQKGYALGHALLVSFAGYKGQVGYLSYYFQSQVSLRFTDTMILS
jgi:hypothetical protein